jgi:hypothetical protein
MVHPPCNSVYSGYKGPSLHLSWCSNKERKNDCVLKRMGGGVPDANNDCSWVVIEGGSPGSGNSIAKYSIFGEGFLFLKRCRRCQTWIPC